MTDDRVARWKRENRERYNARARERYAETTGLPGLPKGECHAKWTGDQCTYGAAHLRVRRAKGSASAYSCVDCGGNALHWSYNHESAKELVGPVALRDGRTSDMAYSPDPSDYDPRCAPCHYNFDQRKVAA